MKNKDFAVFILTHGRPDNVITVKTLINSGYTGKIYFVVDNEDITIEKYYTNFGKENVFVFDKKAYADSIDEGNNFDERRTITHARNASFDIAKKLGITYFMQLDDDYDKFEFRINHAHEYPKGKVLIRTVLDKAFDSVIDLYRSVGAKSIAIAQGGDFIGGKYNTSAYKLKRKCMNSFLCSTDRPFRFVGAMNEDVNTYATLGSRGSIFLSIPFFSLGQLQTQSQGGGDYGYVLKIRYVLEIFYNGYDDAKFY